MDKRGINLIPHAPYSPNLAPADFWLFPAIKRLLAGISLNTQQELETGEEGCFQELYKNAPADVFERWLKRFTKCVDMGGDYVEKWQVI